MNNQVSSSHMKHETMTVSTKASSASKSRLVEILSKFQRNLNQIDAIERRLEETIAEKRQRAVALLDEHPTYRSTHLRLFLSHDCCLCDSPPPPPPQRPPIPVNNHVPQTYPFPNSNSMIAPGQGGVPQLVNPQLININLGPGVAGNVAPKVETKKLNRWTLSIEGRLLVDHLDHEGAALFDNEVNTFKEGARLSSLESQPGDATVPSMTTLPSAQLQNSIASTQLSSSNVVCPASLIVHSRDRAAVKLINDREGEQPVPATKFTHFFDRVSFSFQSYTRNKSKIESTSESSDQNVTSMKGRKRQAKGASRNIPVKEVEEPYQPTGPARILMWNRTITGAMTKDSHAFHAIFTDEEEPEDKERMVVATVRLHRRPGQEQRYKPSKELCSSMFPSFLKTGSLEGRKVPPLGNDVIIPQSLTMDETLHAIHVYVTDRNLQDEQDKGIIHNNATLEKIFACKKMSFGSIKDLLLSRRLLIPSILGTPGDVPIVLTYIMKKDTVTKLNESKVTGVNIDSTKPNNLEGQDEPPLKRRRGENKLLDTKASSNDAQEAVPNLLSFDIDVFVQGIYHGRTRDLLRRMKIREYEYTSSRTKAIRMVQQTRADEQPVKDRLEDSLKGKGLTASHIPVLLALAKASVPGSEARNAAHIEARTATLMEKMENHCQKAKACWDIVEACVNLH